MLVVRKTAVNDDDDANVAVLESEDRVLKLTIVAGGKPAEFEFTEDEWLRFIAGTFDVEAMLGTLGLRGLLDRVTRSRPTYED